MISQEHVSEYLSRTNDVKIYTEADGVILISTLRHGFCSYHISKNPNTKNILFMEQVCGDGQYWHDKCQKIARANNVKTIRFITQNPPEHFCQKYNAKIVGHVLDIVVKKETD